MKKYPGILYPVVCLCLTIDSGKIKEIWLVLFADMV